MCKVGREILADITIVKRKSDRVCAVKVMLDLRLECLFQCLQFTNLGYVIFKANGTSQINEKHFYPLR